MSKPRAQRLAWCGQCDPDSRLIDLPTGDAARCPTCHIAVAMARTGDRGAARTRRRERAPGITDDACPACGETIYRSHRCRANGLIPQLGGVL